MTTEGDSRLAVIDLGSNSFRLVVFEAHSGAASRERRLSSFWRADDPEPPLGAWWKRTDEIYEPVRILAGGGKSGELTEQGLERALATIDVFAQFCAASGLPAEEIEAVATSAIRDAPNAEAVLASARDELGLTIRVLSPEEEARYGFLAAINSTDLQSGAVLDLGGGSMQLVEVEGRAATTFESWPLGAVRMTERFLPSDEPAGAKAIAKLRGHVAGELESAGWLGSGGPRIVGIGGTVRNLAAAIQRAEAIAEFGVQGFKIKRGQLDQLIERLAAMKPADRGFVAGVKPARGDIILAGAIVISEVLDAGGFKAIEVTEAGLREGIFFERLLAEREEPLFDDVRRASVLNLAAQYDPHAAHTRHVAALALGLFDQMAAAGLHSGDGDERELLAAACLLHDIGVAVDYDDHHKHSRYLVLNAGLPGFTPREVALVGQIIRYHRKGMPSLGPFAGLMKDGDAELLDRCAVLLRLAEDLERSRDQLVKEVNSSVNGVSVTLELVADGPAKVPRWAASREGELFERAFKRRLELAPL